MSAAASNTTTCLLLNTSHDPSNEKLCIHTVRATNEQLLLINMHKKAAVLTPHMLVKRRKGAVVWCKNNDPKGTVVAPAPVRVHLQDDGPVLQGILLGKGNKLHTHTRMAQKTQGHGIILDTTTCADGGPMPCLGQQAQAQA